MIAVRIYKADDLDKDWKDVPVACHMPTMLAGSQDHENIAKRLFMLYLKDDPTIIKVRWNYYGNDADGVWVENPNEVTVS